MEPRRFITAFTRARHESLSWARSVQFTAQSKSEALWNVIQNSKFLRWGVVSTSPKPQAAGPPPVGFPRLIIQYVRNYPPYGGGSSIRNLRTRHAVVTETHLSRKSVRSRENKDVPVTSRVRWVACEGVEVLGDGVVYTGGGGPKFHLRLHGRKAAYHSAALHGSITRRRQCEF